jgi:Mg-chelatase subunit ChlD
MTRKIVPIAVAAVALLVILFHGERKHNDGTTVDINIDASDDSSDHKSKHDRKSGHSSTQYALDVQRVNWPPLEDGAAVGANAVGASAVAPDTLNTVNYYVILDGSGSMLNKRCGGGSTKIEAAVTAVKHFFSIVPADANVGLAAFDRKEIAERVPLGVGNRDALNAALANIRAGSDTPLRSSMKIGYEKLTAQARAQLGYGEYHLVVVTDGEPDPDSEDPTPIVREILAQSPVVLHTIGFCIDSDHVLNQPNKTFYASATDPDELQKSLQAVLAESPSFDAAKFE